MLVEAQLSAWAQDALNLGKCRALVVDRAKHQRADGDVEGVVLGGQAVREAGLHPDRKWRRRGLFGRLGAQRVLGLDGQQLIERGRVVVEVDHVARTYHEHLSRDSSEQT